MRRFSVANTTTPPAARRRRLTVPVAAWLLAAAAVFAAMVAAAALGASLRATSGLEGRYATGSGASLQQTEPAISRALLDRLARRFKGEPFQAAWTGYLIVPAAGTYRFAVPADDEAWLEVGGRLVAASTMQLGPPVPLRRGLHELRIRYADHGGVRHMALLWARGEGALYPLDPLLLVPELRPASEVRDRRMLVAAARLSPWAAMGSCSRWSGQPFAARAGWSERMYRPWRAPG